MSAHLYAVMLYARDMQRSAAFYQAWFGLHSSGLQQGLIELGSAEGQALILIHQAAKSVKSVKQGQAGVKLVFAVADVEAYKQQCAAQGVAFGPTHQADGYAFANAKDPDGNTVSISSRAYRSAS